MLTPAVLGSLRIPASAAPSAQALFTALAGQTLEATLESALAEEILLRLPDGRILKAQGSLPFPPGSALALKAQPLPGGAGIRLQVVRAEPPPAPSLLSPLTLGEAAPLLARLLDGKAEGGALAALFRTLAQGGPAPEKPAAWSEWMKEAMTTLADPSASPQESAFHRLQAKEGTGWFELPLPWAPGAEPMRLWVEEDREPEEGSAEPVRRVFLSVPFSGLGDVRLGVEQGSAGLRVRVWLRDPSQMEPRRAGLEAELAALGRPVDLRILPLPPAPPDLRALAGGAPLQAMA